MSIKIWQLSHDESHLCKQFVSHAVVLINSSAFAAIFHCHICGTYTVGMSIHKYHRRTGVCVKERGGGGGGGPNARRLVQNWIISAAAAISLSPRAFIICMKKGSFDCAGRKQRVREVIAPRTAAFLYTHTPSIILLPATCFMQPPGRDSAPNVAARPRINAACVHAL